MHRVRILSALPLKGAQRLALAFAYLPFIQSRSRYFLRVLRGRQSRSTAKHQQIRKRIPAQTHTKKNQKPIPPPPVSPRATPPPPLPPQTVPAENFAPSPLPPEFRPS